MAKNVSVKKNQDLPPQTYLVLSFLLVIATAAVGYFAFYSTAEEDLKREQQQLQAKENELAELEQQEADYQAYRKEYDRLENELSVLQSKLPASSSELNHFLGSITQRAKTARINDWKLCKQEDNVSKGEVDAIPIRIEFQAPYDAAINFFWELASMGDGNKTSNREQIVNIHEVTMTREDRGSTDDLVPIVKVICVAETYLYTGDTANAAPAGGN